MAAKIFLGINKNGISNYASKGISYRVAVNSNIMYDEKLFKKINKISLIVSTRIKAMNFIKKLKNKKFKEENIPSDEEKEKNNFENCLKKMFKSKFKENLLQSRFILK